MVLYKENLRLSVLYFIIDYLFVFYYFSTIYIVFGISSDALTIVIAIITVGVGVGIPIILQMIAQTNGTQSIRSTTGWRS
jgi:hypothetical protein